MSRPRRRLLPPIYFFGAVVVMVVLHIVFPVVRIVDGPWRLLGLAPIATGAAVAGLVSNAFGRRETTIRPFEESSALVTDGLFRHSRNPIYVGMMLVLAGVAWLLGSLSPWLVLPAFFLLIDRRFVRVEERMLTERFGQEYVDYTRRVRRWFGGRTRSGA